MNVGIRFKVLRYTSVDVTVGKVYTIAGVDDDNEPYFIDDVGDRNFSVGHPDGDLEPGGYEIVA